MSLRANTIHCMGISAGRLLSRVAVITVAVSSITTGCAFGRTPATPHIPGADSAVSYRLVQEPDAGYQPIDDLIRASTRSVRMTMYELDDDAAVAALTDARRRGVDVKVILDTAFAGHDANHAAYDALHAAGVQVKWAPNDVIYHQKTITVDDTIAAVGTGNLTKKYYPTSRDAYILTTNPSDVAAIAATFDTDVTAPPGGHPPAATTADRLVWSPTGRQTFLQRIDAAAHTLDITSEELKDRPVLAAIDKAARRGVACRIVLTDNPAWSSAINEVSASGCSVHLLPATPSALYMHEKIILADATTLIIGSQNLSTASLLENRELSLQLDTSTAPDVIAAVHATFDADYHQALPAPSSAR
jgi:cardiolipin synthase